MKIKLLKQFYKKMKYLNYFIQFILTILCFILFKVLGPSLSSRLSGKIFEKIGPFFRSKKIIHSNIKKAYPNIEIKQISNGGKIAQ